jgi:23S rRNA (guanosine2251-2'-O)-methyltransferase
MNNYKNAKNNRSKTDRSGRFDKPGKFKKPEKKFDRKPAGDARQGVQRKQNQQQAVKTRAAPRAEFPRANNPPTPIIEQENSGMVYGRNAVLELLKSGKSIDKIFVQEGQREGSITKIFSEAVRAAIPVIEVGKIKLDAMLNNSSHQGVIALASEKEYCSVGDILNIAGERGEKPFILIADKIMDPHNLGAMIRTAECAGVHGIIIPKRRAAGVSPVVTKTSAGASLHMAVAKVANIVNTISELKSKGVWIFSSALDSGAGGKRIKDYGEADYDMPLALIVGSEGEGLSPVVMQKSDFLVGIPMRGLIGSLNASCAAAVLMYEIAKQRAKK